MTEWTDKLEGYVDDTFGVVWATRDGQVVPTTEDVVLKNGAVKVDAVFLYADLAASSRIAEVCPWETTAKIIRAYLDISTRLIRAYGGHIRSFDGDRVMGVFMGDKKNTHATSCAREIFYTVERILGPKATEKFKSIRENDIKIKNCVGVASGFARAVRGGIRNNNDLIWTGKAPSLAAKLSDVREYAHCVFISEATYDKLPDTSKIDSGKNIWTKKTISFGGGTETVYSTNYLKTP